MEQHALATVLRDLAWTIHRLAPEAAGLDPLPTTELAVLKHIQAVPGGTVTDLSRQLGLQQSNASAAVRNLVERGLAARERDASDRRVTRLLPTEKSLAAKSSINAVWSGTVQDAMAHLDAEEVAAIEAASGALAKLEEVLREEHDPQHRPSGPR